MVLIGHHPSQPPPLRGTSFQRKEGVSTRAPSLGRGCRAQRGGVGFLFERRSGTLIYRRFEMHFLALFHTARTLSGSLCSPPSPRGEGCDTEIPLPPSNFCPFGAPPSRGRREYPREAGLVSFFDGEAAAFIPHFNFSFVQSFRSRSRDGMPRTYYRRTNE